MKAEQWLRERRPAPPVALLDSMLGALRDCGEADSAEPGRATRAAALHVLVQLLRTENATRADALPLLAADALMTYSCEASCDNPAAVVEEAEKSIAAVLGVFHASPEREV